MLDEALVGCPSPIVSRVRLWLTSEAELADATWKLLCWFALSVPFSIALSQTLLSITTAVALRYWWVGGRPFPRTALDPPIAVFLISAILAAFLGLDLRQGLWGTRTYLQVVIIYLAFAHVTSEDRALTLIRYFLAGMIITSAHTVVNAISPWPLADPFPGSMTESGQLLFAIGLTAALWLYRCVWPRLLPYTLLLHALALIANLKRGVWLGALASVVVIGLIRSRRLILLAITLFLLAAAFVPDVRLRITNTVQDLYLPGSRYDIWMAAVDVVERFPMGVGRKNGTILRDYPNIPPNHKHAHNNFLQITMEFGFVGLVAFSWWMITFGRISWQTWRASRIGSPGQRGLALAVFASFIGFHVAGLVEYNFGDTEVLEVVFLMMGLGLAVGRPGFARAREPVERPHPRAPVTGAV